MMSATGRKQTFPPVDGRTVTTFIRPVYSSRCCRPLPLQSHGPLPNSTKLETLKEVAA